jgi:hypothetical protein
MSEHTSAIHLSPGIQKDAMLVRIGGALGIAACIIGLAIFVAACAGFDAAFTLALLPTIMGFVGLVLTVIGGLWKHGQKTEATHELAAVAVSLWGLLGGLVLMAAWRGWEVFYK